MNRILKLAASIFLVVALCFTFALDNVASAASNSNKTQDKKAMRLFRQSLMSTVGDNKEIFHQFFIFLVPNFQGELEFNGKIDGHSLDIAGSFGLWFTGDDGKAIDMDLPFYIAQNGQNMEVYYKTGNEWEKYIAPTLAADLADVVASPTKAEIEEQIAMTKEVTILQDNDSRCTLLVKLDGAKLADELKVEVKKNPADKGTADDAALQNDFLSYLDKGLRNANIWYTWKIDKKNNRTSVITLDLSSVIQETALAALNDSKLELPDEFREILETLAFYTDFKAYTTFLGSEAQSSLIIPQEVINSAKLAEDLVAAEKLETK
ncbi:MAG: hypothetical protein IKZ58_09145 [Selenomonadaceae bacterium]|nr:hypothetical protein [Selenomonadaceae bacterium]